MSETTSNSAPSLPPGLGTDSGQSQWFVSEVHPHGNALKAYLQSSFPSVRDVDDVIQESYIRILKARAVHPLHSAKAFLFTIGRRLAIDAIRRNRRTAGREVVMDLRSEGVLEDKADAAERVSIDEEFTILAEAIHSLPARCQEIMILRKIQRLSHQEIAERLGISVNTVDVQLCRGMDKCTEYLRKKGVVFSRRTQ